MSETVPPQAAGAPMIRVLGQYLKDMSFENPGAPMSLRGDLPAPAIDVGVDVNARQIGENQFEVELACNVTTSRDGKPVFVVECNYAGNFLVVNVPAEQLGAVLMVEAPRLLFPFARQIIAQATRDGGFPPLLLEPLDFAGMYRAQQARFAEGAAVA